MQRPKNNILVTIAARAGSKGIKNKNIKPLSGKPLIYYTIKQALAWNKACRVIVSTDSAKIADMAERFGAEAPFIRPKVLAGDSCGKIPAIKHALIKCEKIFGEKFDIVVDLDVTSPVRTIKDLDNCLNMFLKYRPKTIFSVICAHKNPYFNMVEKGPNGKIKLCKRLNSRSILTRQSAPQVYEANASIYFYDRDYLLKSKKPLPVNDRCMIYIMPGEFSVDIDHRRDFEFLEFLLKKKAVKI